MVIEKSLQRPISVDAHDKQFVQCVSPMDEKYRKRTPVCIFDGVLRVITWLAGVLYLGYYPV